MPRPDRERAGRANCRVCQHPDRQAIDTALANGKGYRDVARTFGIKSHVSVSTHATKHLGDAYQIAMDKIATETGHQIAYRIRYLDDVVDEIIARQRDGQPVLQDGVPLLHADGSQVTRHDDKVLLSAVREARANMELLARLSSGNEPDPDTSALEASRRALADPLVRKLLTEAEHRLAEIQTGDG